MDLELVGVEEAAAVAARLASALPPGLTVEDVRPIDARAPSISASQRAVHFLADFPPGWTDPALAEAIARFEGASQATVRRTSPGKGKERKRGEKIAPGKAREIDLKDIVTHLALEGERRVTFSLKADPSGSAKPAEVLAAVFGDGAPPRGVKVLKEGVSFERTTGARPQAGSPRAPRYLDA
jgi:hypothetical protein